MQNRHVVIIGGGFAGIQAARSVRRRNREALITLIDRTGNATMLPALPDLLSGRIHREALYRPVREVLDPSIEVVVADVRRVNLDGRSVPTKVNIPMTDWSLLPVRFPPLHRVPWRICCAIQSTPIREL